MFSSPSMFWKAPSLGRVGGKPWSPAYWPAARADSNCELAATRLSVYVVSWHSGASDWQNYERGRELAGLMVAECHPSPSAFSMTRSRWRHRCGSKLHRPVPCAIATCTLAHPRLPFVQMRRSRTRRTRRPSSERRVADRTRPCAASHAEKCTHAATLACKSTGHPVQAPDAGSSLFPSGSQIAGCPLNRLN